MRVRWRWILGISILMLAAAVLAVPLIATANDDVGFCLSCHVMKEYGESHASSYHATEGGITCSECHTGSLVQKYTDGARHLYANVTGEHPVPIVLRDSSAKVVAGQCFRCHAKTSLHARTKHEKGQNCLGCHRGHDRRPIILPGMD